MTRRAAHAEDRGRGQTVCSTTGSGPGPHGLVSANFWAGGQLSGLIARSSVRRSPSSEAVERSDSMFAVCPAAPTPASSAPLPSHLVIVVGASATGPPSWPTMLARPRTTTAMVSIGSVHHQQHQEEAAHHQLDHQSGETASRTPRTRPRPPAAGLAHQVASQNDGRRTAKATGNSRENHALGMHRPTKRTANLRRLLLFANQTRTYVIAAATAHRPSDRKRPSRSPGLTAPGRRTTSTESARADPAAQEAVRRAATKTERPLDLPAAMATLCARSPNGPPPRSKLRTRSHRERSTSERSVERRLIDDATAIGRIVQVVLTARKSLQGRRSGLKLPETE